MRRRRWVNRWLCIHRWNQGGAGGIEVRVDFWRVHAEFVVQRWPSGTLTFSVNIDWEVA